MFPYTLILINDDFESLSAIQTPEGYITYKVPQKKDSTNLVYIVPYNNDKVVSVIVKKLCTQYPGARIQTYRILNIYENIAIPQLIVKDYKNGEITINKELSAKFSAKEEQKYIFNAFKTNLVEELDSDLDIEHE